MNVDGSGVDLLGLFGLGVLVNIAAALWACGVAMFLRTEQAGPLIQMPVFVVLFLAPVYVPLTLLTGWIHAVASVNPVTVALEAARGLFAGSPVEVAAAFVLLAAGLSPDRVLGAPRARLGRARRLAVRRRTRAVAAVVSRGRWRRGFRSPRGHGSRPAALTQRSA